MKHLIQLFIQFILFVYQISCDSFSLSSSGQVIYTISSDIIGHVCHVDFDLNDAKVIARTMESIVVAYENWIECESYPSDFTISGLSCKGDELSPIDCHPQLFGLIHDCGIYSCVNMQIKPCKDANNALECSNCFDMKTFSPVEQYDWVNGNCLKHKCTTENNLVLPHLSTIMRFDFRSGKNPKFRAYVKLSGGILTKGCFQSQFINLKTKEEPNGISFFDDYEVQFNLYYSDLTTHCEAIPLGGNTGMQFKCDYEYTISFGELSSASFIKYFNILYYNEVSAYNTPIITSSNPLTDVEYESLVNSDEAQDFNIQEYTDSSFDTPRLSSVYTEITDDVFLALQISNQNYREYFKLKFTKAEITNSDLSVGEISPLYSSESDFGQDLLLQFSTTGLVNIQKLEIFAECQLTGRRILVSSQSFPIGQQSIIIKVQEQSKQQDQYSQCHSKQHTQFTQPFFIALGTFLIVLLAIVIFILKNTNLKTLKQDLGIKQSNQNAKEQEYEQSVQMTS